MNYRERLVFDQHKDRGVMFLSASSYKDATTLTDNGMYEVLTSFHYIKKRYSAFTEQFLPMIKENNGLFMTDSGAFSFFGQEYNEDFYEADYWIPYLESYCAFLEEYAPYIFCAANLDLDAFVGRKVVDKWNRKYFEPLMKKLQIVFIAHGSSYASDSDKYGAKRVWQLTKKYPYVGIGSATLVATPGQDLKFATYARAHKCRLHGFGWTQIPRLRQVPMFSVDSTTWLSAVRYGSTYVGDGVNFKTVDHKHKYVRKAKKILCLDHGIDHAGVLREDRDALHALNLLGWRGARNIFLSAANARLTNKPVGFYDIT